MKKKSFWIRILLSLSLIGFLFYSIDTQETLDILARGQISYLLIALIVALGDRILMAYKWNILLKAKSVRIPLFNVTGTYLATTFLGLFLPATVGGDALRAYAVSKDGHKASDVISSIIVERALGFVALFMFVTVSIILSIFVFGQNFFAGIWNLFWVFLALLVGSFTAITLSLNDSFLNRFSAWLDQRPAKFKDHKITRKLMEVYQSYQSYRGNAAQLVIFTILSLVENLFPLLWTYFLASAFNIEVPLLYFFILTPIVLVLVRLPISFDGFGIQEGTFVYFLAFIGVAQSEALLLGLASHIIAIVSVLPGGVLYGLSGLSLRKDVEMINRKEVSTTPADV